MLLNHLHLISIFQNGTRVGETPLWRQQIGEFHTWVQSYYLGVLAGLTGWAFQEEEPSGKGGVWKDIKA